MEMAILFGYTAYVYECVQVRSGSIVHFKLEYVGQFSQINVASCSLNMLHQNHQVYTACTPIIAHLIKTYNGHQWSIPPTSSFQARPRLEIA